MMRRRLDTYLQSFTFSFYNLCKKCVKCRIPVHLPSNKVTSGAGAGTQLALFSLNQSIVQLVKCNSCNCRKTICFPRQMFCILSTFYTESPSCMTQTSPFFEALKNHHTKYPTIKYELEASECKSCRIFLRRIFFHPSFKALNLNRLNSNEFKQGLKVR